VAQANNAIDPHTYAEAMSHPDTAEWEAACEDEHCTFEHMGVYEVIPCPKDRKVMGSKWVFHIKQGPDNSIQKYKARIVAQGFTQIEGIDYDKTFMPVAKLASLCIILVLANEYNLEVHQMDIKSAYLNGKLQEEIFMAPPPGFDVPDGMVLRLVKAVYGTKQGGHVWYDDIKLTLQSMGYAHTEADHAVFTCSKNANLSVIALYVDDITMASKSLQTINQDKVTLRQHYKMTDLGNIAWSLGIHVSCNRTTGRTTLSQEKYILEILKRFGKSNTHPISTPTLTNEHLVKLTSPEVDIKAFQSTVGSDAMVPNWLGPA